MKAEELRKHPGLPFLAKICCCDQFRKEEPDGPWWCPVHGLVSPEYKFEERNTTVPYETE